MHINWQSLITGAVAIGAASHAANTIPLPDNKWVRWAIGTVQYILANYGKGAEAFAVDKAPPTVL
jgi:hypothetical protein